MHPSYRRCVSCNKVAPKVDFWRVVRLHPQHDIQLDRGMGRSAYLCPTEQCIKIAHKKKRLERALKAHVSRDIYQDLLERLATTQPHQY
jgi:uncharacterized protein